MTIPTASAAPHSLADDKRIARTTALATRVGCDPALGAQLARHVLGAALIAPGAVIAGYWPLQGEIDVRPLMLALADGHVLALPRTPPLGRALTFHRWRPGEPLQAERFGTMAPAGLEITPTVLLVPLLAFDHRGHRLGHGGGYYDRTLAALPDAITIGCAFAAQQVPEVPVGPNDVALHHVAMESGVMTATR